MSTWAIGEEREVSPGNYAKLVAYEHGWVLWSFETAGGTHLAINKAAEGNRPPEPLGVQQAFYGETPFVVILLNGSSAKAIFRGKHLYSSAEFREVGARFATDLGVGFDPAKYDGKRLEVFVTSRPGERAFTKIIREVGIVDMTGALAILQLARGIRASIDQQNASVERSE